MSEAMLDQPSTQQITRALTFAPGDRLPTVAEYASDLITVRYTFVVTALTPIAHSSGAQGNASPFNALPVFDPDRPSQLPVRVPVISGNSCRHSLRAALALLTIRLARMKLHEMDEAAVHFLWRGGSMGRGSTTLDLEAYRRLVRTFPFATLLGGGTGHQLMHGTLKVLPMLLVCQQTAWAVQRLCPDRHAWALEHHPVQRYRTWEQNVGMDERNVPLVRHMAQPELIARHDEASFKAGADRDADEKSGCMPYGTEVIPMGAHLIWQLGCECATPLEHSAMLCGLAAWAALGDVAAKTGTGHGRIEIKACGVSTGHPGLLEALQGEDVDAAAAQAAAQAWGLPYFQHCQEHADAIRSWLRELK